MSKIWKNNTTKVMKELKEERNKWRVIALVISKNAQYCQDVSSSPT
jgi:hypothetical protein